MPQHPRARTEEHGMTIENTINELLKEMVEDAISEADHLEGEWRAHAEGEAYALQSFARKLRRRLAKEHSGDDDFDPGILTRAGEKAPYWRMS